jgi:hypothetical protein
VKSLKSKKYPLGTGFEGVQLLQIQQSDLPIAEQYVHHTQSLDDLCIIVTMQLGLAKLLVSAFSAQLDFTYKCVQGEMKEWEVTIWYTRLNMRKILFN